MFFLFPFLQKDVFWEWWNKRFRGSRDHFFSLPGYGGQTFTKIFTWIFRGFYNSVIFVEKKSKKPLNFCFYHYRLFSKPPRGNKKLLTRAIYHKGIFKPVTCLNWLPQILLNFQSWRIKSAYVAKAGCLFWTYRTLPFKSEIGSGKFQWLGN